jgi:tetratricopeptide (TPR) repeat protein
MRNKKQKPCNFKSVAIVCFALTNLTAMADSEDLSLGKSEYEHGNYQKALTYLDTAIKEQPNDRAFYFRANTLVNLGLETQALLDYQQAYRLTDSATMKDYCLKAMSSLTSNTIPALNRSTSSKSTAYSMKQNQVDQALGTIELQSALDKVRIIGNGEVFAQDFALKQQLKLAEMKREAQQTAQSMQNATYYDSNGVKQPQYTPRQIQDYLDQRQQMEQPIQESIDKSLQKHTVSYQQRAQLTQQSAANLANDLESGTSPDGVKLDPVGTNLYVRNYDFTNSSNSLPKPPVKLKGKAKTHKS